MQKQYSTIIAALFVGMAHFSPAQVRVSGVVRDSAGRPAANAELQAMPRNSGPGDVAVGPAYKWVKADSDGRFHMALLPGRYKIEAKDEQDGYPDPVFALSTDPSATFPTIVVSAIELSDVNVGLGARGGTLDGQVVDKSNESPVANAKITISDASNPQAYVEVFTDKSGKFRFTAPIKPLLLSASADGYASIQIVSGEGTTLVPGEHRKFLVQVERTPGAQ